MMFLEPCIAELTPFGSHRARPPQLRRGAACSAHSAGSAPAGLRHGRTGLKPHASSQQQRRKIAAVSLEERTATEAPSWEEIPDETLRRALQDRLSSLGAEEAARRARNTGEAETSGFLRLVLSKL